MVVPEGLGTHAQVVAESPRRLPAEMSIERFEGELALPEGHG
jgi:hypothetical protein